MRMKKPSSRTLSNVLWRSGGTEDGFMYLGVFGKERGVAAVDMIPGFMYTWRLW